MADQEIELSRIVAEISSIGNTQLAVEPTLDPDLGYRMWGGKDDNGEVTKWLSKDKSARVADMKLQNLTGGGLRLVAADNTGKLVDGSSLIIPAPVDSVFGRTGAVAAQFGDYSAGQIGFTPTGSVSAVDVQGAFDQLIPTVDSALQSISDAEAGGFGLTIAPDKIKTLTAGPNMVLVDNGTNIELRAAGTTAGIVSRVWFTADTEVVNATNYYGVSDTDKGTAPQPVPDMTVTVGDNSSAFFSPSFISDTIDSPLVIQAGVYEMLATVKASASVAQQRFKIEAYRTDSLGNPIASGITGAPIGSEGVATIGILDSGLLQLSAGNETQILLSTQVPESAVFNLNDRVLFKVQAEKVGTGGGNITFTFYCGSNYNTYVDIPATISTDAIIDTSQWTLGSTLTSALNLIELTIDSHITDTTNPHATSIDNLVDTLISTPTIDQILKWDGAQWVNSDKLKDLELELDSKQDQLPSSAQDGSFVLKNADGSILITDNVLAPSFRWDSANSRFLLDGTALEINNPLMLKGVGSALYLGEADSTQAGVLLDQTNEVLLNSSNGRDLKLSSSDAKVIIQAANGVQITAGNGTIDIQGLSQIQGTMNLSATSFLDATAGTLTVGTPTSGLHAANKTYVDTTVSNYVTVDTAQTITGAKTIKGSPLFFKNITETNSLDITPALDDFTINSSADLRVIVNSADFSLSANNVVINSNIESSPAPTIGSHLTNKTYVDGVTSGFVTLNTAQTITGAKTIDNDLEVNEILAVGLTNSSEASLGQNLSMGATASYSWLQSWNSRPLRINGLGNEIEIGSLTRFLTFTNSSPSNGDIWFDGTNLKGREGGATFNLNGAGGGGGGKLSTDYDVFTSGGSANWSANTDYAYTVTVAGASVGDAVVINPNSSIYNKLDTAVTSFEVRGYVSAANTVTMLVRTGSFISLASGDTLKVSTIS